MPRGAKDGLNSQTDIALDRRNILLSSASLIALTATVGTTAQGSSAAANGSSGRRSR